MKRGEESSSGGREVVWNSGGRRECGEEGKWVRWQGEVHKGRGGGEGGGVM